MLTPMDIQQKKFHVGIGFEKKDVTTFFEEVAENYEQLYRSNAELKERVTQLEDQLLNYKSKEASLEKSIMLAEKDSEDKKSKASKEAKNIELDAKNKAKNILIDAETRLDEITTQIETLQSQYALYKSNFASLLKLQFGFLKENDFDVDSYIDPKYANVLSGMGSGTGSSSDDSFGEFTGDPQMRDPSLGGLGSGMMSQDPKAKATSSEVYTSLMKQVENFVDPFDPSKQNQNGRYNPYDGRDPKPKTKKSTSTFTVAESGSGSKNRNRNKSNIPYANRNNTNNNKPHNNSNSSEKAHSPSVDEAKLKAEANKIAEENAKAEALRIAEENAKAEADKIAKEKAKAEAEKNRAEALRKAEEKFKADAEAARLAEAEAKYEPIPDSEDINATEKSGDSDISENANDIQYEASSADSNNSAKNRAMKFFQNAKEADEKEADTEDVDVSEANEELTGEVEEKSKKEQMLIENDDSASEDEDEFGFEFI